MEWWVLWILHQVLFLFSQVSGCSVIYMPDEALQMPSIINLGTVPLQLSPSGGYLQITFPLNISSFILYQLLIIVKCKRGLWFDFLVFTTHINSSPPGAACICQWTGSSLLQLMACHLFGTKPQPEPMLVCCQLDPWEQVFSETWIGILSFAFKKMHLKMLSAKMEAILSRGRWVNGKSPCII